ncbi:MAG: peptidoglycan-binding domain-containing protein, partial [Cyanobacteria bacterium P01_H01_bin.121]
MSWLKLTKQALYLMKGGSDRYLQRLKLQELNRTESAVYIPRAWFEDETRTSIGMVVSVLSDAPEPLPFRSLQVTEYPHNGVEVNEKFFIRGTVDPAYANTLVSITIDNQFTTTGPPVRVDGSWQILFAFTQAGNRQLKLSIGTESATLKILVSTQENDFTLSSSVGWNGQNNPNDVRALKQRLSDLGYNGINVSNSIDSATIDAIRLFQSIILGFQQVTGVDGRVDPGDSSYLWLQASNAPRWELMPAQGEGFFNYERSDQSDNHDYGTNWMGQTLLSIGRTYQSRYRSQRPGAALFVTNNVSQPYGGDTPIHRGHE